MTIINAIKPLLSDVLSDVPMKNHTSFGIGGNADVLAMPETAEELINIYNTCKEKDIPLVVLGGGANVLVSDEGIRGVVVFTSKMNKIQVDGNKICAQAGARLSALADAACTAGLTGLSFASGIPGTVGGAIYMNAGAYGGQMSDVVTRTVFLNKNGEQCELNGTEHDFGYRRSYFTDNPDCVILETSAVLKYGHALDIRSEMDDYFERRRSKQPLSQPSAGSTFKRPLKGYAAALIEQAGLKGFAIGGAVVSEKHSGFIVNRGEGSFADVMALIEHVQKKVAEQFGVELEPEIKIIK
jgi:UDP-N-acetylmuramate dehydrogenase